MLDLIHIFHTGGHEYRTRRYLVHDSQESNGQDPDETRKSKIRATYAHLGRSAHNGNLPQTQEHIKTLILDCGESPNLRIYDALLRANADHRHGSADEVARLSRELTEEGFVPDSATYHAILRALAVHPDHLLRCHIIEELRRRWFPLNKYGWHDLVCGLLRDRQLEYALQTLEHMRKEGIKIESWLYDLMIYTFCSTEDFDIAVGLIEDRIGAGELDISGMVWFHLLDTASRALHHRATLFAYRSRVETMYLNPPTGICINVLNTAARHGDTYLATSVFQVLGRRSGNPIQSHHYEALLETFMASDDLRTALALLTVMNAAGHPPSEDSTRPIYAHLRQSSALPAKALAILEDSHHQNRQVPIQAINVVMEGFVFHCDLPPAISLYKTMQAVAPDVNADTATFNILLRGCARAARKDLAMFLASEMVRLKVAPDSLTYDRLILVCLNVKDDYSDAWRYLEEMRSQGWWPGEGTAIALSKAGCEVGDQRIWQFAVDSVKEGSSRSELLSLIEEYWKGDADMLKKMLKRIHDDLNRESKIQGRKEESSWGPVLE